MTELVDLKDQPPPPGWGVVVDDDAIEALARLWAGVVMPLPTFDYPGTPSRRDEEWWFTYVVLSVSVLACLWPPDGDEMWHVDTPDGPLDDAPGIFACFTRSLVADVTGAGVFDLDRFLTMSEADAYRFFQGHGTLQLMTERAAILRAAAAALKTEWGANAANLVEAASRDAKTVANLLTDTVPGYQDRPLSPVGVLPFDKLSHLAAAIMAAGAGWSTFTGYADFPVYPDYMLPRVFRHLGVLVYSDELASTVDAHRLIPADSEPEWAIRWATVYAGDRLRSALAAAGNPVEAPGLDYHLWSAAVLGPEAANLGPHHRTVTLKY